jgi:alpha-1,6-mannosyltransferase
MIGRRVAAAETWIGERPASAAGVSVWAPGLACVAFVALAVWTATRAGESLVPEHDAGSIRWNWLFLGAFALAFLAYLAGLWILARAGVSRLGLVLAVATGVQLLPLAGPVLLTTDPYTYWDYGRLTAVHAANPYTDTPSEFPGDPAYPHMGSQWYETTTVYGPGFTLLSEGHAAVSGESDEAAAWLYKALAAVAVLALVALAARLGSHPAFAAAFVGWNPVLAVHFAGGGHNDALMMALFLGGLALAASGRRQLAGVAWVLSIAIKWVTVVFLPLRLLADRAAGHRLPYVGLAGAAGVLAGLAFWRYGSAWLEATGPLADNLQGQSRVSIPNRLSRLTGVPEAVPAALALAAFAGFYLWLLAEAWRGRARLALAAGGMLLTTAWLVPWYAVWAVPLAAVEEDRVARWLALGLSAYLLPTYIPL